jgi:hypothetical protein
MVAFLLLGEASPFFNCSEWEEEPPALMSTRGGSSVLALMTTGGGRGVG